MLFPRNCGNLSSLGPENHSLGLIPNSQCFSCICSLKVCFFNLFSIFSVVQIKIRSVLFFIYVLFQQIHVICFLSARLSPSGKNGKINKLLCGFVDFLFVLPSKSFQMTVPRPSQRMALFCGYTYNT